MNRTDGLVLLTLVAAAMLAVMPLPGWAALARPQWLLLVLLYWVLALPERYGVLAGALAGLVQDGLSGSFLGTHMLGYAVVVAVFLAGSRRIRMFNVWQQALLLWLLLFVLEALQYWATRLGYPVRSGPWLLLPPLSGALVWPWLLVFLRGLRRRVGTTNAFG